MSDFEEGQPEETLDAEEMEPIRATVLTKALNLTYGDRNEKYGNPVENHNNILYIWRAYCYARFGIAPRTEESFDAEDMMMFNVCIKLARIAQRKGDQSDSYVDMAAYVAMSAEASQARQPQKEGNN